MSNKPDRNSKASKDKRRKKKSGMMVDASGYLQSIAEEGKNIVTEEYVKAADEETNDIDVEDLPDAQAAESSVTSSQESHVHGNFYEQMSINELMQLQDYAWQSVAMNVAQGNISLDELSPEDIAVLRYQCEAIDASVVTDRNIDTFEEACVYADSNREEIIDDINRRLADDGYELTITSEMISEITSMDIGRKLLADDNGQLLDPGMRQEIITFACMANSARDFGVGQGKDEHGDDFWTVLPFLNSAKENWAQRHNGSGSILNWERTSCVPGILEERIKQDPELYAVWQKYDDPEMAAQLRYDAKHRMGEDLSQDDLAASTEQLADRFAISEEESWEQMLSGITGPSKIIAKQKIREAREAQLNVQYYDLIGDVTNNEAEALKYVDDWEIDAQKANMADAQRDAAEAAQAVAEIATGVSNVAEGAGHAVDNVGDFVNGASDALAGFANSDIGKIAIPILVIGGALLAVNNLTSGIGSLFGGGNNNVGGGFNLGSFIMPAIGLGGAALAWQNRDGIMEFLSGIFGGNQPQEGNSNPQTSTA